MRVLAAAELTLGPWGGGLEGFVPRGQSIAGREKSRAIQAHRKANPARQGNPEVLL